jgi:hypothetical protein
MATKILTLISIVGLAGVGALNAQSPTPSDSPSTSPSPAKHRTHKKAETSPSPAAESTASASPAKQRAGKKSETSPMAAGAKTKAETNATPAPGGGHGLVWVNTDTHVYHKEGSRFYGRTKKGKYMTEADAMKEGDRAAKGGE